MPTTYSDQFYVLDPFSPPPGGTPISFVRLDLTVANDDNDIDQFDGDSIDGVDVISSWPGDTVTVRVPGVGTITYTGTTFYLADGRQVFTPTDGQILYDGRLRSATGVTTQGPLLIPQLGPTCFTPGVLIDTASGPRAIETLEIGDMVLTRDNGAQPIRWIGRQEIDASGAFAPIRFAKGAIGNTAPLMVSPNHQMLITGWKAELFFGEDEILVAAKHLVNRDTIHVQKMESVEYLHLLFDEHEIIGCHGIMSESFDPSAVMDHANRAMQHEILSLFPEAVQMARVTRPLARPALKGYEASLLAA